MGALSILQALVAAGMTVEAACAMGGNMMAESGLKANIAQRGMTKLTDEEYTRAVDNGTYRFAQDGVGYGLCQWTYHTRKANLLAYAATYGKSVGDEDIQVRFCISELKVAFTALWKFLCETKDGYTATERICKEYERPAVNNIEARYKYAMELYTKYGEALTAGRLPPADDIDREPASYILAEVTNGRQPEAKYLAALLEKLGYDVLWLGLGPCITDYQAKVGLPRTGKGDRATWDALLKG